MAAVTKLRSAGEQFIPFRSAAKIMARGTATNGDRAVDVAFLGKFLMTLQTGLGDHHEILIRRFRWCRFVAFHTVNLVFLNMEVIHGKGDFESLADLGITENNQCLAYLTPVFLGQAHLDKVTAQRDGGPKIKDGPLCYHFLPAAAIKTHLDPGTRTLNLPNYIERILLGFCKICRE